MVVEFKDWLMACLPPAATYVPFIGMWQDTRQNEKQFLMAVQQEPAGGPVVDLQRANFRVILLGPQNGREHQLQIMTDAQALITAAVDRAIIPCGAAHVISLGAAMGPGLTTENRPWAQLNFQIIF